MSPEDELPRLEGVQYTTGEDWSEIINSFKKTEVTGQKRKWLWVVDMFDDES